MNIRHSTPSLYSTNAISSSVDDSAPRPYPGTLETAQVETVDTDRADLMLDAGVAR